MRALKVIVVVMGVLLVGGIVALGFAVDYRMKHPRATEAPVPASASARAPASGLPTVATLDLPAGARVAGAEASGDRLVVRVDLAGNGAELIVLNLATGAPVATVILRPQGAAAAATPGAP